MSPKHSKRHKYLHSESRTLDKSAFSNLLEFFKVTFPIFIILSHVIFCKPLLPLRSLQAVFLVL